MRARAALLTGAAVLLALPAIAQQVQAPPPQAAPPAATNTTAPATATATTRAPASEADESGVELVSAESLPPPPPPIEYPSWARRDPATVGVLDPATGGWAAAVGHFERGFLSTLMRRMDPHARAGLKSLSAPLCCPAPRREGSSVDWVAERAWLLLRLGEADAARMLVAGVDTTLFTPKMTQVAVQAALATADPPGLCGFEEKIRRHERNIAQLVSAMCASLAGEPESAAAQIDNARRFGRIGGIDLHLAEKVAGAGSAGRSVTIEWEPVENLNAGASGSPPRPG